MSDNNNYDDQKIQSESQSSSSSTISFIQPLPSPPPPPSTTNLESTLQLIIERLNQQQEQIQQKDRQIDELLEEKEEQIRHESYIHPTSNSLLTPKPYSTKDTRNRRSSGVFSGLVSGTPEPTIKTHKNTIHFTPNNNNNNNNNNSNNNNINNINNNNNEYDTRYFKSVIPLKFDGKSTTTPSRVLSFISSVNTYIAGGRLSSSHPYSLFVAAQLLIEDALLWYEFEKLNAKEGELDNWDHLQALIRKTYIPAAQQQISMSEFFKIKYNGNVQDLLSLVRKILHNAPITDDKIIITVFINAIKDSGLPGSFQLTQQLSQGVAEGSLLNFKEVADRGLLLQSIANKYPITTNKNRSSTKPYIPPQRRNYIGKSTPISNQNNISVSRNLRFNNMNSTQEDMNEDDDNNHGPDENNNENNNDNNDGDENNDDNDDINQAEDNNGENNIDDNDEEEEVYSYTEKDLAIALNAVNIYKKYENKYTPGQLQEIKKNIKCFKCGKLGHYATECHASSQSLSFMKKKSSSYPSTSNHIPKRK